MSYLYARPMPEGRVAQKHGSHHSDNNFGFLASLTGVRCADVDLRWVWRNPKRRTKTGGGAAMALHGDTAASNGYTHIMRKGRCVPMSHAQAHRSLTGWSLAGVRTWRRGPRPASARPRTYAEMLAYVKRHGGTIVGELKSRLFATTDWIAQQLVATARAHNHAPWFKALANMWGIAGKCITFTRAGAWVAIIFGEHIKGSAARQRAGRPIKAGLPADVQARTRIW